MSRPDVSVITPTFRSEKQVVESVQSALAQKGVSVEVIVLDDSPDGSARSAVESIRDARPAGRGWVEGWNFIKPSRCDPCSLAACPCFEPSS